MTVVIHCTALINQATLLLMSLLYHRMILKLSFPILLSICSAVPARSTSEGCLGALSDPLLAQALLSLSPPPAQALLPSKVSLKENEEVNEED